LACVGVCVKMHTLSLQAQNFRHIRAQIIGPLGDSDVSDVLWECTGAGCPGPSWEVTHREAVSSHTCKGRAMTLGALCLWLQLTCFRFSFCLPGDFEWPHCAVLGTDLPSSACSFSFLSLSPPSHDKHRPYVCHAKVDSQMSNKIPRVGVGEVMTANTSVRGLCPF
jgi:hypothetical protein